MQVLNTFCPAIARQYQSIMQEEAKLSQNSWEYFDPQDMWNTTQRIIAYATSSTVLRSYNWNYGLTDPDARLAFESVGAHTNLMMAIVDEALRHHYGPRFQCTSDGFTHLEIAEAVRRHDLQENESGDTPDDGNRDEIAKQTREEQFQEDFGRLYSSRETLFDKQIRKLLSGMEDKSLPTYRLLYLGDKNSAIENVLACDARGEYPAKCITDDNLTNRDIEEMRICELKIRRNTYLASEMWTVDYLKTRRLVRFDDYGFFTSLLVMHTLQAHGKWYSWREADYSKSYHS